jgi:hypothetical protein
LEVFVIFLLFPVDCFVVLKALVKMVQEDPSFEPHLVAILRTRVLALPDTRDWSQHRAVIECFHYTIIHQEERLRTAFTKAGAIEFVIDAIGAPDPAIRELAVQTLGAVSTAKDALRVHFARRNPNGGYSDPVYFHAMLFMTVIGVLQDGDERVVNAALTFLWSDESATASIFVCSSDDALSSLILCLARKEPGPLGATVDRLLVRYAEADNEAVVGAFRTVWTSRNVRVERKMMVLGGVAYSFDKVKSAAGQGGMAEFVLQTLQSIEHRFALLVSLIFSRENKTSLISLLQSILPKVLKDDRFVCHFLLRNGGIYLLLDLFDTGSNIEARCLAASVLSCLLRASRLDEYSKHNVVSLRPAASAALSEDNVLPRILSALHSPNSKICEASLNLLGEILKTDNQSDVDTHSPIKDRVVTLEFAILVVGKLGVPEVAPSALRVLAEMCWAYTRGFTIVHEAFRHFIHHADASFFAALDGEGTPQAISDKRRRVADAAVRAGGISRMFAIFEEPSPSVKACSTTVQAFRTLLSAESANREAGRKNPKFSMLLARLIADGSIDSLLQVALVVRLLCGPGNYRSLESWSRALANKATVDQLISALNVNHVAYQLPSKSLPAGVYQALHKEYERNIEAEAERFKR